MATDDLLIVNPEGIYFCANRTARVGGSRRGEVSRLRELPSNIDQTIINHRNVEEAFSCIRFCVMDGVGKKYGLKIEGSRLFYLTRFFKRVRKRFERKPQTKNTVKTIGLHSTLGTVRGRFERNTDELPAITRSGTAAGERYYREILFFVFFNIRARARLY